MRFRSLLCALLMVAACRPAGDRPPDLEERLRQQEEQLLAQRPAALSAQQAFGADPYKIDYLPGLDRYLVLLRNASQVLLCDPQLKVLDRQSVPRSPAGWARQGEERLYVAGELSSRVAVLALESERLDSLESIELGQSVSVRDLVYLWAGGPTLYLLDGFDRQLLRLDLTRGGQRAYPLGAGPTQILHQDGHLIINLLYEHAILILPLAAGLPDFQKASRIENDGPFWGLAAHRLGDRLIIAAGGIEDHPLDRSGGEFGNVDSFLHLFELRRLERPIAGPFDPLRQSVFHWDAEAERRVSRVNLSELKVVTPKALAFENREGGLELWAAGYGSPRLAVFKVGWNEAGESRAFGGGQSGTEEGTAGDQPESRAGSDPLSGPASRPSGLEVELLRLMESVPGLTDLKLHRRNGRLLLAAANPLLDRVEIRSPSSPGSAPAELASLSFSGQRQAAQASRLGEALFFTTLLSPKNSSEGPLSR
ncbi:MAG TPA: hypothetical protein VLV83_16920, partial [Acidobacteriota bacterium]|nr:hypothetical protein [Acidobacteriota bacterium]